MTRKEVIYLNEMSMLRTTSPLRTFGSSSLRFMFRKAFCSSSPVSCSRHFRKSARNFSLRWTFEEEEKYIRVIK